MKRTTADKRAAFRALHQSDCFVLPNPWDVRSARMLESLGFRALGTTSASTACSRRGQRHLAQLLVEEAPPQRH